MKLKLYLLLSVFFLNYATAQQNCGLYEVPLSERAQVSSLIVEGIVKSSKAQWDGSRKKIYTLHEVEITSVLKGSTSQNQIKVVTQGGEIDFKKHSVSNELELKVGDAGIFLLKASAYDIPSNQTLYTTPSFAQGFIKYQKEDQSAHGPFDHFETIDALTVALQKTGGIQFNRLKPIPWNEMASSRILYANSKTKPGKTSTENRAALATISGFSPTTVQAGRDIQLTITGSGFGASRGTNYVAFKYASDGGGSYIQPYSNQYVSWSDTQIVVKVPSNAGTGNILLNIDGTATFSSGTLTVDYAILNIEYTYNNSTSEYTSLLRNQNLQGGYTFKYTADVPAEGKTYFQKAAKDWVCDTGVHFFVSTVPSSATTIANDDENTVDYEALGFSSGTIAQVTTYSSACLVGGTTLNWYVDELDMKVNSSLVFYYGTETSFPGYDFYTAVLHEMGHANQVGHVIDSSKLMYYSLDYGEYKRSIDTAASNAGNYWTDQSISTTRCGKAIHKILNCTSSVSFSSSVSSIDENGTSFTLTATQNQINFSDVVVNFAYSGTANSATDFTAVSSITIPAGSLSATATITLTDDALYEGNETIIIDVATVTNGTENGTQSATVTIIDNETIPTVSLLGSATLAENSNTTVIITAALSGATTTTTSVYISRSGTATYNTDYFLSTVIITIPAGSLTGFLTLTTLNDTVYEGDETAFLGITTIISGSGVTPNGTQLRTITILDDDASPTVTLSTAATAITETAGSTTVTSTLSAVSGMATTVELGLSGTANSTADYTMPTSITIPAGSTSASVTLNTVNDAIYEANQTVVIDIIAVTNGTENGTQQKTVTITDDDPPPTVSVATSSSGNGVFENSGTLTIIVTLSTVTEADTTINFAFSGTATHLIDYNFASSIVIPAGSTAANITYSAVDDTLWEALEMAVIDVDSVINGTENGTQKLTLYILDNETAPTVSLAVSNTSLNEGTAATTTITATLSSVSAVNITANLAYSGLAGYGTDYTSPTSITIPAGSLSASINLSVTDDAIYESAETIIIDIVSVANANENGVQQQTLTINDNDTAPSVTLTTSQSSIAENNGSTTVTATLAFATEATTTVHLGFSGSATASTDYSLGSSIIIPAGSLSGSINLNTLNDQIYEGSETVIIDIASVTNGIELGTQQKTVSITDDETTPKLSITTSTSSITENGGSYTVTANLSNASTSDVSFFLINTGSAVNGTDFNVPFSNIIAAGSTSLSITVNVLDDNLYEINESVTLNIGTVVTNAIRDEEQKQVTTLIVNDDLTQPNVSLSVNNATIAENGGTSAITATLSEVSGVTTTVAIAFSGTAIYATDYSVSTTITIPAGSLSASLFLNSINDAIYEPNENILIDVILISGATENGVQQQTISITDDDSNNIPTVSLSVNTASVAESTATMPVFTVTLSTVSGYDTTVNLSAGGTATYNTDYTLSTLSVVIPAGSTTGTAILNLINETLYEVGETVIVQINTVTNGTENGTQSQTVTITNDDARPTVSLSVNPATVSENGTQTVTITATLSEISAITAAVGYTYSGTATNGTDYSISGSGLIPAGSLTNTRTLTVLPDTLTEGNETVVVDITSCTQCTENGVQQQTITIIDDENTASINLKLFLEGYYEAGSHAMVPVKFNQGVGSSTTYVDDITVELRNATTGAVAATTTVPLQTNGAAVVTYQTVPAGFYYIAIKHRNSIQTWSATPQLIGTAALTYDFTNAANKAYGDNMKEAANGVFVIYTGDVNQDETIDPNDYSLWEGDANDFAFGYYGTDLNGDGLVDLADYSIWEVNANNFIYAVYPIFN